MLVPLSNSASPTGPALVAAVSQDIMGSARFARFPHLSLMATRSWVLASDWLRVGHMSTNDNQVGGDEKNKKQKGPFHVGIVSF